MNTVVFFFTQLSFQWYVACTPEISKWFFDVSERQTYTPRSAESSNARNSSNYIKAHRIAQQYIFQFKSLNWFSFFIFELKKRLTYSSTLRVVYSFQNPRSMQLEHIFLFHNVLLYNYFIRHFMGSFCSQENVLIGFWALFVFQKPSECTPILKH